MSRYITITILCIIVMLHASNDVLNTVYLFLRHVFFCRLAWCVQHHVSSRSTILLFYHGSRHSLDIQMEPYINHSV